MGRRALARVGLIAVSLALGLTASAQAAAPVTLTTDGEVPQLAVDSAGAANVVWTSAASDGTTTVHYCKVLKGGTGCSVSHDFPGEAGGDARVVLGPAIGEVVVFNATGFGDAGPDVSLGIDVWVSMDGGATFSAGAVGGGYNHTPGDGAPEFFLGTKPAFGPGGFSVSMLDDDGYYQDTPTNAGPPVGSTTDPANIEDTKLFTDGCSGFGNTSVAMVNSTTPIAGCQTGSPGSPTGLEYRIATGQGDIDNAATGSWGPVQTLPIGNISHQIANLVGGPRGVFVNYGTADGHIVVSHLSGTTFGPATPLAATAFPLDFSEDSTGNLYAAYGREDGSTEPLGVSTSQNGTDWTSVPLDVNGLAGAPEIQVDGCAAATADQSGSGWVLAGPGDTPGGKIVAEPFGTSPCGGDQGNANCPTQLTVGAAHLLATNGCFAKQKDGTYTTASQVELNGLMIDPSGSASSDAHAASADQLVVNTVNRTLSDTSAALVQASNISLAKQKLDWLLPAGSGTLTDLATKYAQPVTFDPSSLHAKALGFDINGLVTPTLKAGGDTQLPVNVAMPSPIGGFIGPPPTDDLNLTASNSIPGGLSLSPGSVHIDIPDVSLGIAELTPFDLDYDSDPEVFDGRIGLELPVLDNSIETHFRFEQGSFLEGDATADFGMDFPVYPDVFLQKVNIHVAGKRGNPCTNPSTDSDGPTSIGGGITAAVGPILHGTALLSVDGDATYTFPESSCHQPGVFAITGNGKLFGFSVATAHATFATDGNIGVGANVAIGNHALGIFADVEGDIQARSPFAFYAEGDAQAYLFGLHADVEAAASSIGIGACITPIGTVKYKWGGSLSATPLVCTLDDLKPAAFSSSLGRPAAATGVTIPAHQSADEIVVTGSGAPPQVTVAGPGGARLTTPALSAGQPGAETSTPAFDVLVAGSLDQTAIKLNHPAAGHWTVTPLPGSAPITGVSVAHALPPVSVKAHVLAGSDRTRSIAYTNTPAHGRVVKLVETGAGAVAHVLGQITGAHGTIRFIPENGPAGRRTILAEVTERGLVVGKPFKVAAYVAPGPPKLTRPQHVTVKRRGSRIVISWDRVAGADRYVVRAVLADGRALVLLVPHGKHAVDVSAVTGLDTGTVMVAALDASNQPGPTGTEKLSALKPTCLHPTSKRGKLVCAKVVKKKKTKKHAQS